MRVIVFTVVVLLGLAAHPAAAQDSQARTFWRSVQATCDSTAAKPAGALGDFLCIAVAVGVAPQALDRAQRGEQGRSRHDHDLLFQCERVQSVVVVHGLDVGRLDRHEHQHEIQRIQAGQIGITLVGEFPHMLAQ